MTIYHLYNTRKCKNVPKQTVRKTVDRSNWAERSLRTIILQRKNSLFFKTINSAEIHSGLYSIVKTCSENEINAFKYLNWLQEQSSKAKKRPANYTPFAYARYMNNTELIETAA